jgi:tripartite-type tricarboxylate transporter receptor subunit TctC
MTHSFRRRALLAAAACASALVTLPARAQATDFPKKPITLVIGFAAGGSNDIIARAISQPLAQLLGVPVVVETRLGAAAVVASNHVARSAPDGHTLLVTSASPLVIAPHTNASIPYDSLRDFAPVSMLGITPETLAIHPAVPARNLAELVELARKRDITLGSAGAGGLPHLGIELLKRAAPGTRIVHVPYNGATPAVTDALGGHVSGVVMDLPAVYGHIKAQRLRGIAMANEQRSEFLPDLPTGSEQQMPDFVAVNWIGMLAPAKTPQPVIDKLHEAVMVAIKQAAVKNALAQAAVEVSVSPAPAHFQAFIAKEHGKWGKVVKDAGVTSAN